MTNACYDLAKKKLSAYDYLMKLATDIEVGVIKETITPNFGGDVEVIKTQNESNIMNLTRGHLYDYSKEMERMGLEVEADELRNLSNDIKDMGTGKMSQEELAKGLSKIADTCVGTLLEDYCECKSMGSEYADPHKPAKSSQVWGNR